MIIDELRAVRTRGVLRAEARVRWETTARPPQELFVEVEERFADLTASDPNAWLIAALLPAWRAGEPRLLVEGPLCPVLCQRVKAATASLSAWYPADFGVVPVIEAERFEVRDVSPGRSVSLLSCGIDSLATLRWNTLHVPRGHPSAIDAVVSFSFDERPEPSVDTLLASTSARRPAVEAVSAAAGVTPIALRSNLWWLVDDGWFYDYKWQGAVYASLLSFFARAFRGGYVASSAFDPAILMPWGSHPLLDGNYSSAHFRVEHDLFSMTRLEKTALVADWPQAAANIRVCQNDALGGANCGTCEKCIRTLVSMAALGKLESSLPSFPGASLTAELILTMEQYRMIEGPTATAYYRRLVPLLRQRTWSSVADALETVLAASAKRDGSTPSGTT